MTKRNVKVREQKERRPRGCNIGNKIIGNNIRTTSVMNLSNYVQGSQTHRRKCLNHFYH